MGKILKVKDSEQKEYKRQVLNTFKKAEKFLIDASYLTNVTLRLKKDNETYRQLIKSNNKAIKTIGEIIKRIKLD